MKQHTHLFLTLQAAPHAYNPLWTWHLREGEQELIPAWITHILVTEFTSHLEQTARFIPWCPKTRGRDFQHLRACKLRSAFGQARRYQSRRIYYCSRWVECTTASMAWICLTVKYQVPHYWITVFLYCIGKDHVQAYSLHLLNSSFQTPGNSTFVIIWRNSWPSVVLCRICSFLLLKIYGWQISSMLPSNRFAEICSCRFPNFQCISTTARHWRI